MNGKVDWDRKIKPHNFKAFLLGTFVKFICYNELKRKPKERMRIMKQEMLKIMNDRRSVRSYKKDLMIPEDVLQEIPETATYAPTGGGRQSPVIIAVTDKTMRDHIAHLNAKIMGDENADPFYGAPAIALVLADGSKSTWVEDGTNVLCYLMLAAKACDVSSVWVHREKEIFDSEEGKKLLKQWNLPENLRGVGAVALGYLEGEEPKAAPRKEGYIVEVR